jgi:hypothetical protein
MMRIAGLGYQHPPEFNAIQLEVKFDVSAAAPAPFSGHLGREHVQTVLGTWLDRTIPQVTRGSSHPRRQRSFLKISAHRSWLKEPTRAAPLRLAVLSGICPRKRPWQVANLAQVLLLIVFQTRFLRPAFKPVGITLADHRLYAAGICPRVLIADTPKYPVSNKSLRARQFKAYLVVLKMPKSIPQIAL